VNANLVRPVFIFGAGGHARVIASLLDRPVTFIDRDGEEAFLRDVEKARKSDIYVGVGENAARRKLYNRLKTLGISLATCVAPTAFIARSASLGAGCVVCPGAVVMTGAILGENVILNTKSSVDHDCQVGDHTQITVGVTLPGGVHIGESAFFGVASATFPRIVIGDNVVVRGGSLVIEDVPDNVVVGGNPAKILRSVDGL
jgi:sugar O-acyltransferase (sialic acid O-acetyltransferase NeuD family)